MDLAQESAQALDGDGLHVVAVVVQLLQHGRADAPLHGGVDLNTATTTTVTTTKTVTTTARAKATAMNVNKRAYLGRPQSQKVTFGNSC